ncbi:helix-turn-helix domain-containing protein [Streptomyces sp. NPDC006283]|uniref:helix-turn-helix domain-containing protein n=1 Tax=Streptomyces sp. NPDC006283 TaxID=3156741 RepID=UPI0033ADE01A
MSNKAPPARARHGPATKVAQDLKKKYDSGTSIWALAEEKGRSYGGVHRLLADAGVTFRSRGGDRGSADS